MPKISVIIPVYNQEKYLRDCLDSVINQDLDEVEVIIVNDGSTDSTAEICREYKNIIPNCIYIEKKNGGLGSARNTGLVEANGEYIMFLDSDDKWEYNILKTLYFYAKTNNKDIVYFDELVVDCELNIIGVRPTFSKMHRDINKQDALRECFSPSHVCARMYKRGLIADMSFKNMWYEDMEWFPKVLSRAKNIGYFKVPIYYYRQHPQGITSQKKDYRNLQVIEAWKSVWECYKDSEEECKLVGNAIKASITEFLFFRKEYARDILRFYNDTFYGREVDNSFIEVESDILDMPIYQQANFYNDNGLVSLLNAISQLWKIGGCATLRNGVAEYEGDLEILQGGIVLNEDLTINQVVVDKNDIAINKVIEYLGKQNLISLKGERKKITYEKELILQFLYQNYKIEIKGEENYG